MQFRCFECQEEIHGEDTDALGEAFLTHARSEHDWPYGDQAIRNYAAATQRLTGGAERLQEIGEIEIHPVTADRMDDWIRFFDHDAFVGTPEWADCYCIAPFRHDDLDTDWRANRSDMIEMLTSGSAFGYLAYVDGEPAGWANASMEDCYTPKLTETTTEQVDRSKTIGASCFIVAPPYRRHGVAEALLDRVIEDAPSRGATVIDGYPFNQLRPGDAENFRGPRPLFDRHGFDEVEVRERDTVVRRTL